MFIYLYCHVHIVICFILISQHTNLFQVAIQKFKVQVGLFVQSNHKTWIDMDIPQTISRPV